MPSTQDLYGIWEIDHTVSTWGPPKGQDGRTDKADLSFISTLKFSDDGTVKKEAWGEGFQVHAFGEFVIEDVPREGSNVLPGLKNAKMITVTYLELSEGFRPSNCTYDKEIYYLLPGGKLENRDWSYCDGPRQYYVKL